MVADAPTLTVSLVPRAEQMKPDTATIKVATLYILLFVTAAVVPAHGAEYPQGLFGDWGGVRHSLVDHGIELQLSYINELARNVSGGSSQETADADQIYLGGSLDLHRLMGVPGAKIIFSLTDRNGESLSVKAHLNTLLEVQEIYGEGNYTRLNQLYWEQQLFGKTLELKLGRMTGTFDFMPFSCNFQNITFCATLQSHGVVTNWVAFPGSTWAGLARVNLKKDWYLQAGVYEVNPKFQEHQYRFAFGRPFGGRGTRVVAEAGWLPSAAGPDGGYRIGAWYDDVGGDDLFLNTSGQPLVTRGGTPLQRHHQSGFYAMAQQRVWAQAGSDTRGLSLFVNFVQSDRNITAKDQIVEIGAFWTGPFSFRPQDDLGVAIGRVHVNRRIAAGEILYNAETAPLFGLSREPVQHAEYPMEIYYSVNITPAITIRPNVQFIHAPGGVNQSANVVVLGLHSSIAF
jgi:porin